MRVEGLAEGNKKILVIGKSGYSRICAVVLEFEGYGIETLTDFAGTERRLDDDEYGLIITSYPYCCAFFEGITARKIPTIILTDHIDSGLIGILEKLEGCYCMLKPVDYEKFRSLVKQLMKNRLNDIQGECKIV